MVRRIVITVLLIVCGGRLCAQSDTVAMHALGDEGLCAQSDTVAIKPLVPMRVMPSMRKIDHHTSTKAYQMTFVGVPLIVGGVVMMSYDRDFRDMRNGYAPKFHYKYDDYLQYAPAGLMVGLKACGYKSRSSWGRMLVSDAFSVTIMAAVVNSTKRIARVRRPDGSARNSFPSGHTATAFMTATMLHKEYGARSPWFSIAGYTMATVVGVTRQLNNRHWVSDVMVGAGIGILSTELAYWLADLIFKDRGLNFSSDRYVVFDRYRKPSFFGLNLGLSTIVGNYRPQADMDLSFATGPTVSVQGAWFASPYVGVGGRLGVSNMNLRVNGVALSEHLESASAVGGLYASYPVSARWLVGSKLLAGYEQYKSCDTGVGRIGDRGGVAFGTGFSMTYVAYQNMGVRFTADYDAMPAVSNTSRQYLHRLTFGLELSAMF